MSRLPVLLTALAALALPLSAHADSYTFSISTDQSLNSSPAANFVASGTFSGSPSGAANILELTGITGAAQGYTFTGIAPLSTQANFAFDNLLYTDASAAHVDGSGILLYLSSEVGTSLAHVYDKDGYHVDVFDPGDPADVTPFDIKTFDLNPSSVPEPSTLALLGTGALGVFTTVRRKFSA